MQGLPPLLVSKMISLNQIGFASSLTLSSGRMGLFSNEKLVAVYDGTTVHHVVDIFRMPVNSLRHAQQWTEELGIPWEDQLSASPLELERILLED